MTIEAKRLQNAEAVRALRAYADRGSPEQLRGAPNASSSFPDSRNGVPNSSVNGAD
jgi:hypothetical protein